MGHKLAQALSVMDSHDCIDQAFFGCTWRGDRAPKGSLHRTLERVLEGYLGKKGSKKSETDAKMEEAKK